MEFVQHFLVVESVSHPTPQRWSSTLMIWSTSPPSKKANFCTLCTRIPNIFFSVAKDHLISDVKTIKFTFWVNTNVQFTNHVVYEMWLITFLSKLQAKTCHCSYRKFPFPLIVPVQIWAVFKRLSFHMSHCPRALVWFKQRLFGYQTYHFIMQHITGICSCGAIDILWQKVISVAWTTSRRFNEETCKVLWSIWQVNFDQGCGWEKGCYSAPFHQHVNHCFLIQSSTPHVGFVWFSPHIKLQHSIWCDYQNSFLSGVYPLYLHKTVSSSSSSSSSSPLSTSSSSPLLLLVILGHSEHLLPIL